jgi:hypothetical protein
MAKVRLRRSRANTPLILQGKYEITTRFTEIPFRAARRLIGDSGVVIEWTEKDRREIKSLPDSKQNKFARALGMPEGLLMGEAAYRRKDKKAKKEAKKETPPPVVEEVKEETPALEPLPPKLEDLTVKELKKLLDVRELSTEGKKADLIKRLSEEG